MVIYFLWCFNLVHECTSPLIPMNGHYSTVIMCTVLYALQYSNNTYIHYTFSSKETERQKNG